MNRIFQQHIAGLYGSIHIKLIIELFHVIIASGKNTRQQCY